MSKLQTLPSNWSVVELQECAVRITDGTHLPPKFEAAGVPFLFVKHIVGGKLTFEGTRFISESTYDALTSRCPIEVGDVLYTAVGSYGVAVPVCTERRFAFQRHIAHIKLKKGIDGKYLAYCLNSPLGVRQAHAVARGVAQKTVTLGSLRLFSVPIAPLDEQRRIVAKIEELLSDLDVAVAALERVRTKLKRYRSSVLHAAVTGKLTDTWRQQNPPIEVADKLLARILDRRREQWEKEQFRKYTEVEKTLPKDWKAAYPAPSATPDRIISVPDTWATTTVDELAVVIRGSSPRPAGDPRYFNGSDTPWITVGCLTADERVFLTSVPSSLTADGRERSRFIKSDTLLLTNSGATLGVPKITMIDGCINDGSVALLFLDYPLKLYLHYYLKSQTERLRRINQGAAQPNLNTGIVKAIAVPLPPTEEQRQIVAEVERRMSVIEVVEIEVEHGLKRAARLRQTILKQAFEGKLVPQQSVDAQVDLAINTQSSKAGMTRRRGRVSRAPKSPRRKHRKGIVFDRGAVMARVVRRLGRSPYFGRTEAMKTLYVGEAWLGIDLELEPVREKRGPLDKAIYMIESLAQKQQWFTTKKVGTMFRYTVGPNIQNRLDAAERIIGDKLTEFDRLLDEIEKLDTDRAELFATSFAVWNDLLLDQKTADSPAIISGVHGWHPSKIEKFPADRIERCIKWMNEKGFVPTGRGPRSEVLLGDGESDDEEG